MDNIDKNKKCVKNLKVKFIFDLSLDIYFHW